MESINRLREYVENASRMSISLMARATLLGMVRDIEQEVGNMVPLPVDADGVPIHVGDVMEWVDIEGTVEVVCTVDAVGVDCFFAWDAANCQYAQKCANAYRHHHAPTVEDVLREFAEKITDSQVPGVHPTYEEAIAEFAAKLTLRGEE